MISLAASVAALAVHFSYPLRFPIKVTEVNLLVLQFENTFLIQKSLQSFKIKK